MIRNILRTIVATVVLASVLILAPTGNKTEKGIGTANASPLTETMTDLLFATVHEHPCAIIVMAANDPSIAPTAKAKAKHIESKVKKKSAHAPTKLKKKTGGVHKHHHSHHHHTHHHDAPKKISGALGPLHLTSPPGCV